MFLKSLSGFSVIRDTMYESSAWCRSKTKKERNFEWKQQIHAAAPMKSFLIPIGNVKNPFWIGWWFTDKFCQDIRKSAILCMKHSGWSGAVNIRKVYENGKIQLRPARLFRFIRSSLENLDQIKKLSGFQGNNDIIDETPRTMRGTIRKTKEKENVFDRSIDRSDRNRNQSRLAGSCRSCLHHLQQLPGRLKGGLTHERTEHNHRRRRHRYQLVTEKLSGF